MNLANMSTRQLRAFIALVEERNFTRAADKTFLSQPAFSALIRSIETVAGVRLFDRSTRHVELTPEGVLFEGSARRLLGDFELAMEELSDHVAKRKGRASVAALPSLASGWLPGVLGEFRAEFPGVALELHDALLEPCLSLVRLGRVDFALAANGADMSDFTTELLCVDSFYLVCRKDHPLAQLATVRLRDVADYPFIQLARSSSVRQHLDAALHPVQMQTAFEVEHLATVTGLVVAGLGVSLVPEMTLSQFSHPDVAVIPLSVRGPTRSLYLVRRRDRSMSAAAEALYTLIKARRPSFPAGKGSGRAGAKPAKTGGKAAKKPIATKATAA
ncbi:LysR family transcriptional regulator [Pigmentiphaga litoralis]|uniref:DNA-binding transcriptional LysR family regulator n=1 Tax=Pigmentiphaga litoralis TaxID=516702 RepID=A0A7Y9J182_9BURK|nr:LysR family transcriptional regulator [Pigmentiphaga litoralis]NYE26545.1 DNA-binding transcriptional LysR family regulator [Pigmentiphaga litoralis]NYE86044.1 DNA-binding transcriptional LysR family regulator [Pigmentiphaga litoralis]